MNRRHAAERASASVAIAGTSRASRDPPFHESQTNIARHACPAATSRAILAVAPRVSFCPERGSVSRRHELAMTR